MSSPPPFGIYFIKNPNDNTPSMIIYFSNSILIRKNTNPMKDTHPVLSKHDYYVILYDVDESITRSILSYNQLAGIMRTALDTEEYNQYQLNDYFEYKYGIDFFEKRIQFAKILIQKTI